MGCPIRKSWDHRSLAATPSLSQLAASFIACDAKVSTCMLFVLLLHTQYCIAREIASASGRTGYRPPSCLTHESSSLCSFQRSESGDYSRYRSRAGEPEAKRVRVVPSKLNSTVSVSSFWRNLRPRDAHVLKHASLQESSIALKNPTRIKRLPIWMARATTCESRRAANPQPTLALRGRRTPGLSSIVCGRHKNVRHCNHACAIQ